MQYKDSIFRGVDRQFCIFALNEEVRAQILEQLAGGVTGAAEPAEDTAPEETGTATLKTAFEGADSFLGYGFVDPDEGLSLVVLAPSRRLEEGVAIQQVLEDVGVIVRVRDLTKEEYFNIGGTEEAEKQLRAQFGPIVEEIDKKCEVSAEIRRARGMQFLDPLRRETHPDDIEVRLYRPGCKEEAVWVRLIGTGTHHFTGRLLQEPHQDFGVHKDSEFTFALQKVPEELQKKETGTEGQDAGLPPLIAVRSFKITRAESLNGTLLTAMRDAYKENPCVDTWGRFLEVLNNCFVWIPCNADFGGAPASDEAIELRADILSKGDKYFFPVFSTPVEMGEKYAAQFSLIEKPFREAVAMAERSEVKLTGIVFNAFSDNIVVNAELFDYLKGMPDMVED